MDRPDAARPTYETHTHRHMCVYFPSDENTKHQRGFKKSIDPVLAEFSIATVEALCVPCSLSWFWVSGASRGFSVCCVTWQVCCPTNIHLRLSMTLYMNRVPSPLIEARRAHRRTFLRSSNGNILIHVQCFHPRSMRLEHCLT